MRYDLTVLGLETKVCHASILFLRAEQYPLILCVRTVYTDAGEGITYYSQGNTQVIASRVAQGISWMVSTQEVVDHASVSELSSLCTSALVSLVSIVVMYFTAQCDRITHFLGQTTCCAMERRRTTHDVVA